MSKNSVNKAVIFVSDDNEEDTGVKFPAKSELNNIISDILKGDSEYSYNLNTRKRNNRQMNEMNRDKLMESDKLVKEIIMKNYIGDKVDTSIKEDTSIQDMEIILNEIRNRIASEEEQRRIADDKADEEKQLILFAKIKSEAEDEIRAEIKALMESQIQNMKKQMDTKFKQNDELLALVFQDKNDALLRAQEENNRIETENKIKESEKILKDLVESRLKLEDRIKIITDDEKAAEVPPAEVPPAEVPPAEVPPAEEPQVEAPPAEASPAEVPPAEASPAEASPAEEPSDEVPLTVVPLTEVPLTEEPTAEEPTAEEPTAEEPTAEEPTAEEPTAETPTAEAPTAEAPTAEVPLLFKTEQSGFNARSLFGNNNRLNPVFQKSTDNFSNKVEKFENSFFESSTLTWILAIILGLLILFVLNRQFHIINL